MESSAYTFAASSFMPLCTSPKSKIAVSSMIFSFIPWAKYFTVGFTGAYYFSTLTQNAMNMRSYLTYNDNSADEYVKENLEKGTMTQVSSLSSNNLQSEVLEFTDSKSTLIPKMIINDTQGSDFNTQDNISDQPVGVIISSGLNDAEEFDNTLEELRALHSEFVKDVKAGTISGVEKAYQKYLDLTFRESRVHRAWLDTINKAIREPSFVKDSRTFGIDLINEVVKDKEFQHVIKETSLKVIRTEEIKQRSMNIIKFVVTHPTIRAYTISMMIDVLTNTDAKEELTSALAQATLEAVKDPITVTNLSVLFKRTAANKQLQSEAKKALIFDNLIDLFTPSFLKSTKKASTETAS